MTLTAPTGAGTGARFEEAAPKVGLTSREGCPLAGFSEEDYLVEKMRAHGSDCFVSDDFTQMSKLGLTEDILRAKV